MDEGMTIQLRKGLALAVSHHPGGAPPLVFLHGGLGNRFNWRSQMAFAKAQGWEALAYDLAGHGSSSPYRRYSIGRHGRDLTRLLERFGITAPVLCCHSYGVPIGLEWAQRHPTRAVVLIAGGTHDLDPWWEIPLMTAMAWGGRHLFRLDAVQRWGQALMGTVRSPQMELFQAESPIPTDHHSYKALDIFWGYDFFARSDATTLRRIPALVITGGQDPCFSAAMGEQLASHFDRAEHLHLPEAGHLLMAEHPDAVNGAIGQWIMTLA
jgi:pimeloyl-ACP methyl ester carboxylesterase